MTEHNTHPPMKVSIATPLCILNCGVSLSFLFVTKSFTRKLHISYFHVCRCKAVSENLTDFIFKDNFVAALFLIDPVVELWWLGKEWFQEKRGGKGRWGGVENGCV